MSVQRYTLFAAMILAACSSNPAPVRLSSDAAGRQLLVGAWAGSYQGRESGRSGSIEFKLLPSDSAAAAGQDERAFGDVLMIPSGRGEPLRPIEGPSGRPIAGRDLSQVLTIELVRISGNSVSGTMAPYREPECDCAVATRFEGVVSGDVIEGTFVSSLRSGQRQTGTWKVTRRP